MKFSIEIENEKDVRLSYECGGSKLWQEHRCGSGDIVFFAYLLDWVNHRHPNGELETKKKEAGLIEEKP